MSVLSSQWFELFGLPTQFEVDQSLLTQRFRALQTQYHPDRFAQQSDAAKRESVQVTSLLNEAYIGLKSPRLRARYLLEQAGVFINDERDTISDKAFLIQQMAWREALEEASEADDPLAALEQVGGDIQAATQATVGVLAQAWQQHDLVTAKQAVLKMRFYERLQDDIRRREEQFDA